MSGFILGIVIGCFAGSVGTLLLLLVVHSIPDGEYIQSQMRESWLGVALMVALVLGTGVAFSLLNLRRVAFATSVLLLLVFLIAHTRGVLVSWTTLAIATLLLCLILPPARSLRISDSQDRMLLAFFVICGAIGTRLIAHTQKA